MSIIETERLRLREWSPDDLPVLHAILSDPITMQFWPAPLTIEDARGWIKRSRASYAENGWGRWAVIHNDSSELVGDCGLMRSIVDGQPAIDLGYIIDHRFWGQGYASEAAAACVDFARDHGIERLVAHMSVDHIASARVAEKLGMRRDKIFNNPRNRDLPTYVYVLDLP